MDKKPRDEVHPLCSDVLDPGSFVRSNAEQYL